MRSVTIAPATTDAAGFPIPMRGNETAGQRDVEIRREVSDPHEG